MLSIAMRLSEGDVVSSFVQVHVNSASGQGKESYIPPVKQQMDLDKPLPTSNDKNHHHYSWLLASEGSREMMRSSQEGHLAT